MKTTLYLIPRYFPYPEKSKSPTPFYLVHGGTGEVLHFFNKKNDLLEDFKKSINHQKRIDWIFNSKEIEIKEILYDSEIWKDIKDKIYSWHERKKEEPHLLLIIDKGTFQIGNEKPRFLFDLVNYKTGEIIETTSCSDKLFAHIDLKNQLKDIRNRRWVEFGNRCTIKYLSETNITIKEIERKVTNWAKKTSFQEALKYFNIDKK